MQFFRDLIGNAVDAGQGFVEGLTGASRRKREAAKGRQKAAKRRKEEAKRKSENISRDLSESVSKAREINRRQDEQISAAQQLSRRSLSTSKATAYQSRQLQIAFAGVRKDLKVLATTSASSKALSETNEVVADLSKKIENIVEADKEYKDATDEAIEALNKEASDTTAHLDALTEAKKATNQWGSLATDALPWARMALSALNVEKPTNEIAYYAYLGAKPFLKDRLEPALLELVLTGLQILAYWDDEGVKGLLASKRDIPAQYELEYKQLKEFVRRPEVAKALKDNNISLP